MDSSENLKLLKQIEISKKHNQRELAKSVGLSLGKVNYCLKALKNKGLIKIKNFKNSQNKIGYFYVLTPKGVKEKTKIALNFIKLVSDEFDNLNIKKK